MPVGDTYQNCSLELLHALEKSRMEKASLRRH